MWPFKKKPAAPRADDLTAAEEQWLREQRHALEELAASVDIPAGSPLQRADALIRWWHTVPASDRPDANIIVNAAGVALGDALAADCSLAWKIITDPFGTDLGLWWNEAGAAYQNIILTPTHSVAKKFAESPQGPVVNLHRALSA